MEKSQFVCAVPDDEPKQEFFWNDEVAADNYHHEQGKAFSKVVGSLGKDGNINYFGTEDDECECPSNFKSKSGDSEVHKKEAVNHPDHYNFGKYETIDIIRDQLTEEEFTGFCLGNAIKYISRCQHKGKMVEDIRKAIWYLEAIIEN